jgi:phage terminase large subunit-like protein
MSALTLWQRPANHNRPIRKCRIMDEEDHTSRLVYVGIDIGKVRDYTAISVVENVGGNYHVRRRRRSSAKTLASANDTSWNLITNCCEVFVIITFLCCNSHLDEN